MRRHLTSKAPLGGSSDLPTVHPAQCKTLLTIQAGKLLASFSYSGLGFDKFFDELDDLA